MDEESVLKTPAVNTRQEYRFAEASYDSLSLRMKGM
jgi:hypothetical protein